MINVLIFKTKTFNNNDIVLGDSNILGDVNGDGKINTYDYIVVRKYILNTQSLTTEEKLRADVNRDNKISSIDYMAIKKSILYNKPIGTIDSQVTDYKITFNANGGNVSINSKSIKKGVKYGDLPNPTRNGYRFIGWFTKPDASFDANYYSNTYADLKKTFGNDYKSLLNHWLDYGKMEGRICSPYYRNHLSIYNNNGNETLYANWVSINDFYSNTNWNKYSITYSSSVPLKGTIIYNSSNYGEIKETFFLEASGNGIFTSYINYWINGNVATGIKSFVVEDFKGNQVNVNDIRLYMDSTANDLLNKYSHTGKDYNSKTVFIKNSYLTLGISLEWGGSVTYLSGTSKTFNNKIANQNIVNTWDAGREIQDSLYGNANYNGKSFGPIGSYNPVQAGNTNNNKNNGSKIINISINEKKDTITIISRPLLWSINNSDYIRNHANEYSGYASDGYIYQTYKLVNNKVEFSHSYIDFSDNYSNYYNCSGHGCPFGEVPVIYATANLNVLKYKDIITGENTTVTKNSTFDDPTHKVKIVRARYAGLYNQENQGIGMYIRNLESYSNYNNYGSMIYFHSNFYFIGSSSSSSKSGDTVMLHLLNHIKYSKAKRIVLPSVVFVLGSYNDLENLSSVYK